MNVAIIPARGGSKRVPRKNLREFCGQPILTYSIAAAHASGVFDRIVVSTDDPEIAELARRSGAEVPFVRPPELATDHATTVPVIRHAIEQLQGGGDPVRHVCCIYATAPFVRATDLRAAHDRLVGDRVGGYVFSATSMPFPIQRAFRITPSGTVEMFAPENYAKRSQDLEPAYQDAGQFYWGSAAAFLSGKMFFAPDSVAYLLPRHRVQDIDTPEDWERAELLFRVLQRDGRGIVSGTAIAEKVLVTGATGLLGCELTPLLCASGRNVATHARRSAAEHRADLTRRAETEAMLDAVRPDVIVNLAALTDVDVCQHEPERAYEANVLSVENLVRWIAAKRPACHLIQVSTDQVYDGAGVHAEDDVCIRNTYAFSKIAAEHVALRTHATVLRTNFFGRSRRDGRASLTDWLYRSIRERQPIRVFDDIRFSPLPIDSLSTSIVDTVARKPSGVFNLGCRSSMSKADFAFAFADALGLPTDCMSRASSDAAHLQAPRPKNMSMDVGRYESAMNVTLPNLQDEVRRIGRSYREHA